MKSSIFLITWVLFSSVVIPISSKDVISRRQLWTTPKYAPSTSSSYSNNNNQNEAGEFRQSSGSSLSPNYSYITSQVSSSTSEVEDDQSSLEEDISAGSESQQVDTIEQYTITKDAESYPPPPPNNKDYKQSNSNGSNGTGLQQEAYGGPDLTLQSRPVVYTPPHVTFHPPQIIISESGVVFTDPHTTYSHELPSGPQEGGQMIAYQPLQVQVASSSSSSHLPQNVQVSYPQFPQQGPPQPSPPQQGPSGPYRQQVYQQPQPQPQMNYNNINNNQYQQQQPQPQQYQGPPAPAAPQPGAQIPYQHHQQLPYPLQYPPQQQPPQQQQQEATYPLQQQQQQMQQMNQQSMNNNGIGNRDRGRMRLKRGQPQKESSSVPAASGPSNNAPHGRWPLSTITFQPVNK